MPSIHAKQVCKPQGINDMKNMPIFPIILIIFAVGTALVVLQIKTRAVAIEQATEAVEMLKSDNTDIVHKGEIILQAQHSNFAMLMLIHAYSTPDHPLYNLNKAIQEAKEMQQAAPSEAINNVIVELQRLKQKNITQKEQAKSKDAQNDLGIQLESSNVQDAPTATEEYKAPPTLSTMIEAMEKEMRAKDEAQ